MPANDYQRHVSNEQRKRRTIRILIEILISALLIIPAIGFSIYRREIIHKMILNKVKLEPNSNGFKTWLNPPISTTRSYYLFNITNPNEIVTEPSSTPIKFQDTPPYAYSMKTSKTNVQWSNKNKEISYAVERSFIRDPKRFNPLSVNDTGIFVDLLRAIFRTQFVPEAAFRTQFVPQATQAFYALGGNNVFYHRNAVEQLEGFTSDLFNTMQDKMIGPNTGKSGLVYRQNGSRLYNVSIDTDLMKKGQLHTFASELVQFNITSPSYYPFPVYDSLTYPPMLFDKLSFNLFNSDFCRPLLIEYNRSVQSASMFQGINMYEYQLKLVDYENCTDTNDTRTCPEVDKIDVSKCISASIPDNTFFLSKAHFYGASNETIQEMNIDGFTPIREKHDSVVYFEPYSGTPFKASFRMQLNIEAIIDPMKQSEYGTELEPTKKKGVRRLIPIFWIDQEINISKKVITDLRRAFFLQQYGQYVVVPLAIVLAIVIVVIIEILARRASKNGRYIRGTYIKSEI